MANKAAAAFAANGTIENMAAIVGRRFSVRIAFGCDPAQAAPGILQGIVATGDEGNVTLTVRPALWDGLPLVQKLPNRTEIEAVEGFWIPRPWAATEVCPLPQSTASPAVSTPPSAQTLGLARFFARGESRAQRHAEHPYQTTLKREVASGPYRFLIEGEIASFADGNPLACWAESPAHHPVCLYAVTALRVAFEGQNGEMLAQWNP